MQTYLRDGCVPTKRIRVVYVANSLSVSIAKRGEVMNMSDVPLHKRVEELEGELMAIRKHIGLVSEGEEEDDEEDDEEDLSDDSDEADDDDE
jgi:hypothetical protein